MIRAYAIGLAADPGRRRGHRAIFASGVLAADLAKAAGWVINLAAAEWVFRRPARRHPALRTGLQQAGARS
jgi:hypothetical protein